jgi:uncharacterized membrane protein YkoI
MKRKLSVSLAAALAAAAIGGGAYAAKADKEDDAVAIVNAKVTLTQAVTAAEQHVGGKAAKAEFEQSKNGKWTFDVEVVKDAKTVMDVKVDADTGKVLSATADTADHDDENDKD